MDKGLGSGGAGRVTALEADGVPPWLVRWFEREPLIVRPPARNQAAPASVVASGMNGTEADRASWREEFAWLEPREDTGSDTISRLHETGESAASRLVEHRLTSAGPWPERLKTWALFLALAVPQLAWAIVGADFVYRYFR